MENATYFPPLPFERPTTLKHFFENQHEYPSGIYAAWSIEPLSHPVLEEGGYENVKGIMHWIGVYTLEDGFPEDVPDWIDNDEDFLWLNGSKISIQLLEEFGRE